jgi:hypothetical protein
MRTGSRFIVLVVCLVPAGCGTSQTREPTSPTAPTPSVPTVSVHVEGIVVDADRNQPVPDALVKGLGVVAGSGVIHPAALTATTDARGAFGLAADLPSDWSQVQLVASRAGYEDNFTAVQPATPASAVLRLQETLTIRPGESLKTRVFNYGSNCYDEGYPCRRILVDAGDLMDIEVVPEDSGAEVGLQPGAPTNFPFRPHFDRRITMRGGEFWVVAGCCIAPQASMSVMLTVTPH